MMELGEIQEIFTISRNGKFWNIFLPKNLANEFYSTISTDPFVSLNESFLLIDKFPKNYIYR